MSAHQIPNSAIDQLESKLRKTMSKGYDDLSEMINKTIKSKATETKSNQNLRQKDLEQILAGYGNLVLDINQNIEKICLRTKEVLRNEIVQLKKSILLSDKKAGDPEHIKMKIKLPRKDSDIEVVSSSDEALPQSVAKQHGDKQDKNEEK